MNSTNLPVPVNDNIRENVISLHWTQNKTNVIKRTTLCIVAILIIFRLTAVNRLTDVYSLNIGNLILGQSEEDGNLPNSSSPGKKQCKVDILYDLTISGLRKIQDERKSRIKEVCDMCHRNRTSMECKHVTLDEDYHKEIFYRNLIVDDKHKVYINLYVQWRLQDFPDVSGEGAQS